MVFLDQGNGRAARILPWRRALLRTGRFRLARSGGGNAKKRVLKLQQQSVQSKAKDDEDRGRSKKTSAEGGAAEKMRVLFDHLHGLMEKRFTGHVKVNFSQGGIGRIEQYEEILKSTGKACKKS